MGVVALALFEDTFPPAVPFGSRILALRSPELAGTDVAVLQAVYDLMLQTMNPPQGPMGSPVPITGVFDAETRQAVINIQSYFGLAADGIVGPNTYFLFGQGVGPHTTYGGPVYGSRTQAPGSSGGDVLILQNRLNTFRYASIIGRPADGTFDNATAQAVQAFKADAIANGDTGLLPNPIVGAGAFDATWLYTFAGGRGIFPGRNGFDVVFVQVLLRQLGLYAGRITGYYDAVTQAAVRAFQRSEGIAADGVVGPVTFYHLGLHNRVAAPQPLGIAWPPAVPPPVFSDCAVALTSTGVTPGSLPVPGGSVLIRRFATPPGAATVLPVTFQLPPPQTFGSQFTRYATLVEGFPEVFMEAVDEANGIWIGERFESSAAIRPDSAIAISPSDLTELGPAVLVGNVRSCCSPDSAPTGGDG